MNSVNKKEGSQNNITNVAPVIDVLSCLEIAMLDQ